MTTDNFDLFDVNDPMNLGRPIYWDLEKHVSAIIQMIQADEIQIALKMCDEVPGFYRQAEHCPKELLDIKKTIYRQCYDIFLYGNDDDEASQTRETCEEQWFGSYCFPRGQIITDEIRRLNSQGLTPWLFDLSCSHGNAPIGLLKAGVKFHYLGKSMNYRAANKIKEWIPDRWREKPDVGQEAILICTEALEHAWDPSDIVRSAYKTAVDYDQIFLSTPNCTLGGGLENWSARPLGHVRTWSAEEFRLWADTSFPGYTWQIYLSHSMVLHGRKNNGDKKL